MRMKVKAAILALTGTAVFSVLAPPAKAADTTVICKGAVLPIASNLSDLSGDAWGCGAGNCRIIDYLVAK
jgi:hypothetical protein